jgi:hypothetical protein
VGQDKGHLDLRKARRGGFAGGLFAIFVPSPGRKKAASPPAVEVTERGKPIDKLRRCAHSNFSN